MDEMTRRRAETVASQLLAILAQRVVAGEDSKECFLCGRLWVSGAASPGFGVRRVAILDREETLCSICESAFSKMQSGREYLNAEPARYFDGKFSQPDLPVAEWLARGIMRRAKSEGRLQRIAEAR